MKAEDLKEHIKDLAREGRLSHAYIIERAGGNNINWLAKDLARWITPYEEDIHTIGTDGISVKDKSVESLLERLNLKPLVGDRNVAIVQDADTMTQRAQNRLLKTLEEPPGNSIIFLLSNNNEKLLPTVRSRCVSFKIDQTDNPAHEGGYEKELASQVGGQLLRKRGYYKITNTLKDLLKDKESVYNFLDELEKWYRDVLLYGLGLAKASQIKEIESLTRILDKDKAFKAISAIEEARRDIYRHINLAYAVKYMILKIIYEEESI